MTKTNFLTSFFHSSFFLLILRSKPAYPNTLIVSLKALNVIWVSADLILK